MIGAGAAGISAVAVAGWIAVAPIASAVIGQGIVVVESGLRVVQHADGGIVKSILIRDGDLVTAGQILLQLDQEKQNNLAASLEASQALLFAREARLRSEIANSDHVDFLESKSEINTSIYKDIIEDQRQSFIARKRAITIRTRELNNDADQDVAVIVGLQKQLSEIQVRINLADQDQSAAIELARTGTGTKRAMRDAEAIFASLLGEQAGLQARIAELVSQVGHSRLEIERLAASFQQDDEAELQQVTREKQDVAQRLADARLNVRRSDILAPVDGRVMNLSAHTVGGVIAPNSPILEIVPTDDHLVIEAHVEPVDSDNVSIGSAVMVRSTGAGSQRLPMVAGAVSSISPDRIVDRARGLGYFLVRVTVDRAKMLAARGVDLRPGVPVDIMIKKKTRSAASYLLDPLISTFTHALRE